MSLNEINKVLLKKVSGLISSIETMTEREKHRLPSKDYGENINHTLEKAREANPEIADFIPSNVTFDDYDILGILTETQWMEVHAKLKQLYELLEE